MVFWTLLSYVYILLFVALGSGLFLVPTYRVQRWRRKQTGTVPGPLGRSLYWLPALTVAWLGLGPLPDLEEAGIDLSPVQCAVALTLATYLGAAYLRRALEDERRSTLSWVIHWPGWPRDRSLEPTAPIGTAEKFSFIALPTVTALTSLTDLITKASNLYANSPAVLITQFAFLAGTVGTAVHCLTSTSTEKSAVGIATIVPRYQRSTRIAALLGAGLAMLLWAIAAAYEAPGTIRIISQRLPDPDHRVLELVVANQTDVVHVLSGFHVKSRTAIPFQCLSGQFDIPELGDYTLKFHIGSPLTKITADPLKQLPPQTSGRLRIVLEPNATGACADHWSARMRVFLVSDDGSRAPTRWFRQEDRDIPGLPPAASDLSLLGQQ